ncbi:hypothetical protein [Vibrio vulnificus YJ016]|uniref:Uncharacterized protein n=1 Tax=Vibrio vulnificus (strain YJ016) TaxID=196600 RepID=Q7MFL2_VIBVY|nr:hypothetical protein [Vibrio vulnificus YJ016]
MLFLNHVGKKSVLMTKLCLFFISLIIVLVLDLTLLNDKELEE